MRAALSNFKPADASHAGQLLGPLFNSSEKEERGKFLQTVAKIKPSDAYTAAFERWKAATDPDITATTSGPLAIGLGNASPTEVGLTLHRTYGLPYLPGSALKGLAVRAARDHKLSQEACGVLFGTTESAAHIIWWDGWLDPQCKAPLQLDTITVHHQKYYGSAGKDGQKEIWPTDFDDPNPVAFLSVPIETKFHLALGKSTPKLDDQWVSLAAQLLEYGLSRLGLGSKTNAGYGGFEVVREKSPAELAIEQRGLKEQKRIADEAVEAKKYEARAQQYAQQIDRMNLGKAEGEVRNLLPQIKLLPKSFRNQLLSKILERLEGDGRTKGNKKLRKSVSDLLNGTT